MLYFKVECYIKEVDMINQIINYLEENVQTDIKYNYWDRKKDLIFRFQDRYNYYETELLGNKVVLIEEKNDKATIDEIKKLMQMLRKYMPNNTVMIFTELSSYKRKIMIQERIPFIIANGQMYLPFLGLDLSLRTEEVINKMESLSSSTQLLYLYFLYNKLEVKSIHNIAQMFQITNMHASRILKELYQRGLITFEVGGKTKRTKFYKRIGDPEYYIKGSQYLQNPVQDIVTTNKKIISHGLKCGLPALAEMSLLNKPKYESYIISKNIRNKLAHTSNDAHIIDKIIKYEVWAYDPSLITTSNYVDILSLYLSLRDLDDPRVDEQLIELMRGESWYKE